MGLLVPCRRQVGDTIDLMLSEQRDEMAATAFFKQAIHSARATYRGY